MKRSASDINSRPTSARAQSSTTPSTTNRLATATATVTAASQLGRAMVADAPRSVPTADIEGLDLSHHTLRQIINAGTDESNSMRSNGTDHTSSAGMVNPTNEHRASSMRAHYTYTPIYRPNHAYRPNEARSNREGLDLSPEILRQITSGDVSQQTSSRADVDKKPKATIPGAFSHRPGHEGIARTPPNFTARYANVPSRP